MPITKGEHGGFCFGVKRAIAALDKQMTICDKVYTYGEIIHNPVVVEEYSQRGATVINSPSQLPEGATVIIRSHGAALSEIEAFKARGNVVDATCVFVKKIHKIVSDKYAEGYQIIIVGRRDHPEVIGINGWCNNSAIIISNEEEELVLDKKACIVAQTTIEREKFSNILKKISKRYSNLVEIFDTICYTTIERQNEAEKLAKENDLMVVIGGKTSSNTEQLAVVCRKHCNSVVKIERASELEDVDIATHKNIGVVAGASTPEVLIKEVFLKMADKMQDQEVTKSNSGEQSEMMTMDDVMKSLDKTPYRKGQTVEATISEVKPEGLMLQVPGFKADNFVTKEEVSYEKEYDVNDYSIGDPILVKVVGLSPLKLSHRAIAAGEVEEKQINELLESKKEFSMTFNETNKGGLTGRYGSWNVFVPASQIKIGYVNEFDKYKGKPMRLEVIEVDGEKKKIIASQKVILERERLVKDAERTQKEEAFWNTTEEGQIVEGKVVRISDFGAFVSVGGFDCLAHKSDLSWTPVEKVESVIEKGKSYQFVVLKLDKEAKRVSLGYKQLQPHPWDSVEEKYPVGSVIKGKVARIVSFGAFVELESGIDGLVHVSQICHEWVANPTERLKVGEEIEAKVLEVDGKNQKITLSIKALTPAPEQLARLPQGQGDGEERSERPARKTRFDGAQPQGDRKPRPRRNDNEKQDDSPKAWVDSASKGASIGDMLKALNLDINGKE